MSEFIGRSISFGVAKESTRGTAASSASKWVRKTKADVIPKATRVIDQTSFGTLEDSDRVRTVRRWNEGTLEGNLHADVVGYFFMNLYGSPTTTADSSAYSHAFTLSQSITHPTLSLFVQDGDVRDVVMPGAVISSLEITAQTDKYVAFNAAFVGKQESTVSSTPSFGTDYDWISKDIVAKVASTNSGLSSATALKLKDLSIKWTSGAVADYVFGSISPDNIYNGTFAIEGKFTRNFTDTTFEDMFTGDTDTYMQIDITGDTEIDTGIYPELTILLNKVQITDWQRISTNDQLVTEEVSFKAFYNSADTQQSSVTLVNLTSSY